MNDLDFVEKVFDRVFHHDILRLKEIKDLWNNRKEPVPLRYQQVGKGLIPTTGHEQDAHISYYCVPALEESFEMFRFRYSNSQNVQNNFTLNSVSAS